MASARRTSAFNRQKHDMTNPIPLLFLFGALGCAQTSAQSDGTASADSRSTDSASVQGLGDDTVAEAATAFFEAAPHAVGLSLGVVSGGAIQTYHFGATTPGGTVRPTDQSVYAIASITKTVTGSLLARAALDGRLSLDDDIRQHLDGSYPNLEHQGLPVRVAHLITHTSGLPRMLPDRPEMSHTYAAYGGDPILWMRQVEAELSGYTRASFYRDLRAVRLDTIPGTRSAYSNAGAQLAGFLLERVYGRPFDTLVDSLIAHPIGMEDTGLTLDPDEAARLVNGYDDQGRVMPVDLTADAAAGGLKSTVADLARYVRWHLDESDPVVQLSHTPQGDDDSMGLNWHVLRSAAGVRRISSDGTVPGYHTRIVLYPDLGIGIVVLVNELDRPVMGLTSTLADTVLESLDARAFTHSEAM